MNNRGSSRVLTWSTGNIAPSHSELRVDATANMTLPRLFIAICTAGSMVSQGQESISEGRGLPRRAQAPNVVELGVPTAAYSDGVPAFCAWDGEYFSSRPRSAGITTNIQYATCLLGTAEGQALSIDYTAKKFTQYSFSLKMTLGGRPLIEFTVCNVAGLQSSRDGVPEGPVFFAGGWGSPCSTGTHCGTTTDWNSYRVGGFWNTVGAWTRNDSRVVRETGKEYPTSVNAFPDFEYYNTASLVTDENIRRWVITMRWEAGKLGLERWTVEGQDFSSRYPFMWSSCPAIGDNYAFVPSLLAYSHYGGTDASLKDFSYLQGDTLCDVGLGVPTQVCLADVLSGLVEPSVVPEQLRFGSEVVVSLTLHTSPLPADWVEGKKLTYSVDVAIDSGALNATSSCAGEWRHVLTKVHTLQAAYAEFNTLCPMKVAQNETHTNLDGVLGVYVVSDSGGDSSIVKTWIFPLTFLLAGTFTVGSKQNLNVYKIQVGHSVVELSPFKSELAFFTRDDFVKQVEMFHFVEGAPLYVQHMANVNHADWVLDVTEVLLLKPSGDIIANLTTKVTFLPAPNSTTKRYMISAHVCSGCTLASIGRISDAEGRRLSGSESAATVTAFGRKNDL
mmetsp:Transcript_98606/g.317976  ORF Transcript_98606/g.317976 Transcript_98606/m.317976 type:complete len:616 (+) Transcript_98606:3-1850(+)